MWFSENWAKIVALVVAPIVAGLSGSFSVWAADNLPGTPKLDGTAIGVVVTGGILAGGAVIYKYLDNRGKHELAKAKGEIN